MSKTVWRSLTVVGLSTINHMCNLVCLLHSRYFQSRISHQCNKLSLGLEESKDMYMYRFCTDGIIFLCIWIPY